LTNQNKLPNQVGKYLFLKKFKKTGIFSIRSGVFNDDINSASPFIEITNSLLKTAGAVKMEEGGIP